ncbi:MAG: MlaD family protein [Rhodothermales bacterium]
MSRQARVGLVVFAGLSLFFLALFALANRSFLFSDTFHVRSQFNRVSGLQAGGAVQFQGVNVGRVESVRLPTEPGGKIVVSMAIQERARHLVRTNTQAQIKTEGLVGNMIVVLVNPAEVAEADLIEEGDFIPGVDPFDVFEITDKAVASVQRFEKSATSFEQIIIDIQRGEGTLGKLIYDPALYDGMVQTADETQRLMANLGDDAEALVDLAGEATQGVQSILAKVDEGEGTMAKLINDPAVYNSLLSTADTLQAISTNLRVLLNNAENLTNWGTLGAYRFAELMEAGKHNWLFKRYFEERGYMESAQFEMRERAINDSYRKLEQKELELQEWEARLKAQAARLDSTATEPASSQPQASSNGSSSNNQ